MVELFRNPRRLLLFCFEGLLVAFLEVFVGCVRLGMHEGLTYPHVAKKALLFALLEPIVRLRKFENSGDAASRLALLEEAKLLPVGEVWNEFCRRQNVPDGFDWMDSVKAYEAKVTSKRS